MKTVVCMLLATLTDFPACCKSHELVNLLFCLFPCFRRSFPLSSACHLFPSFVLPFIFLPSIFVFFSRFSP